MAERLTAEAAKELTERINSDVINWRHVAQAWEYKAWATLGYPDWESYCSKEVRPIHPPGARLQRGSPEHSARLENVTSLRAAEVPSWAIAHAYHISPTTVSHLALREGGAKPVSSKGRPGPQRKSMPIAKSMRTPVADMSRGARRVTTLLAAQEKLARQNREMLRNLYLTELRLVAQHVDSAIEELQK